jgi:ankyrin repeat protein
MAAITEQLLAAALAGETELVRKLLGNPGGRLVDGPPDAPCGVTPLMAAAAAGASAIVELLLDHGADPARRDCAGRSAAAYARGAGHTHLAEQLDIIVDKEKTMW